MIYLPNINPPSLVFSLIHSNLLFLLTTSTEIEPLLVLEFLHRVVDILEEFIGSPLLAPKIESNYEIVAQLLNEICDSGFIITSEPNALRDLVEVEGWIGKLLGNMNIPAKPGYTGPSSSSMVVPPSSFSSKLKTPTVPWRRANVRHTCNEVYIDIIETLSVTLAPSGRPLAAFANGTIICTSRISGIPELLLNLSTPSGKHSINNIVEFPVFHPCVRLSRWKERPGEILFIPPDGKFTLAGYGVDLLPIQNLSIEKTNASTLKLPVNIEMRTGLGPVGSEFEVRLLISKVSSQGTSLKSGSSLGMGLSGNRVQSGLGINTATSTSASLQDLVITIPLRNDVRNLSDIKASRGEINYSPGGSSIKWEISVKEATTGGANLRCSVTGPFSEDEDDLRNNSVRFESGHGFQQDGYQNSSADEPTIEVIEEQRDVYKVARNKNLMPTAAVVSFSVGGWLASGIKVESLLVDTKGRGLSDGVRPTKGVKYLTVSQDGLEIRC